MMQVKTLLTGLTATAALCLAGVASGQTFTWNGSDSSDWFDADNWTHTNGASGYPDSANAEVFVGAPSTNQGDAQADPTLDFDLHASGNGNSVTVGILTVEPEGILTVQDSDDPAERLILTNSGSRSGQLVVEATMSDFGEVNLGAGGVMDFQADTDDPVVHQIGGDLVLQTSTSQILISNEDATFGPYSTFYGFVKGENNAAEIEITDGEQLTSRITVQGAMIIQPESTGSATFVNERASATNLDSGVVRADELVANHGTLTLAADLTLQDLCEDMDCDNRPLWAADGSSADLVFNEEAGQSTALEGEFSVTDNAVISINENVTTNGPLTENTGGDVVVASGKCFLYDMGSFECN